jgi:PST family polysaccharide transporter
MSLSSRVFGGTIWWLLDRCVVSLAAILSQVLIARELGAFTFGVLSVALASAAICLPFIHSGLSGLISRALIESPTDETAVLQTAFSIRLLLSAFTLFGGFLLWQLGALPDGACVFLLLVGQVGVACQVIEYRFQTALDAGGLVPWRISAALLALFLKLAALWVSPTLGSLVIASATEPLLLAAAHLIAYRHRSGVWLSPRFHPNWTGWFTRRAPAIMLAVLFGTAYSRGDVLWLKFLGAPPNDLGIYALASKLILALELFSTILVSSIFPAVWSKRGDDRQRWLQRSFDLLSFSAILIGSCVIAMAPVLTVRILGSDYASVVPLLSVSVWICLFSFPRTLIGRYLISENLLIVSILSQLVGFVVSLAMTVLLYREFGIMGASVAVLLTYGISNWLIFFAFRPTRPLAWMASKSLLIPFRWRSLREIICAVLLVVRRT